MDQPFSALDPGDRVFRDESKVVGFSTYGIVYEGTLDPGQIKVAVKVVRYGDKSARPALEVSSLYAPFSAIFHNMYQRLLKEAYVWSKLDHENVIKLLGLTATGFDHTPSMVSPLMSRGSAFDYVQYSGNDPRPLVCSMSVLHLLPFSQCHLDPGNSKRTALPPHVYRRPYYSWRHQRRGCTFF